MTDLLKSCSTCEHRCGSGITANCMYSGFFCQTERRYQDKCGIKFEGWSQRRGLFTRVRDFFSAGKAAL